MQIRALEVFVELARADSIRQAAQRLGLAPTAISRHVDQLEYHFRARLIDRTPNGIILTEAGRLLAERAHMIVAEAQSMRSLIADLRGLERGQATIHAGGAAISGLVAPVLSRLHARYPGLRFHVDVASAGAVFAAVADGSADLGVTMFSPEANDRRSRIDICHSSRIGHAVIVSPTHRLAGRTEISMRDLAQETLAIPDIAFGVRQTLERMARATGIRLDPVFVTGVLDLQKSLALQGVAALVLPPICCSGELASGALVAVKLATGSEIETSLDICKAPERSLSFAAQVLLAGIVERSKEALLF